MYLNYRFYVHNDLKSPYFVLVLDYESDKNPPFSFKLKIPVIVVLCFGNYYYIFNFVYRNVGRIETNLIL